MGLAPSVGRRWDLYFCLVNIIIQQAGMRSGIRGACRSVGQSIPKEGEIIPQVFIFCCVRLKNAKKRITLIQVV